MEWTSDFRLRYLFKVGYWIKSLQRADAGKWIWGAENDKWAENALIKWWNFRRCVETKGKNNKEKKLLNSIQSLDVD